LLAINLNANSIALGSKRDKDSFAISVGQANTTRQDAFNGDVKSGFGLG
jgi:hypothetical protein